MTRINVGIAPDELCDQHLLAEYRELPRVWRYVGNVKGRAPAHFRLGKGHVLWCAQYPEYLKARFAELVAEMQHRGFAPRFRWPPYASIAPEGYPHPAYVSTARRIMKARINDRLSTMRRPPRWTNRIRPKWVEDALNETP